MTSPTGVTVTRSPSAHVEVPQPGSWGTTCVSAVGDGFVFKPFRCHLKQPQLWKSLKYTQTLETDGGILGAPSWECFFLKTLISYWLIRIGENVCFPGEYTDKVGGPLGSCRWEEYCSWESEFVYTKNRVLLRTNREVTSSGQEIREGFLEEKTSDEAFEDI